MKHGWGEWLMGKRPRGSSALRSKSKNTPYDLRRMQGRVLRTWVAGREVFAREAA